MNTNARIYKMSFASAYAIYIQKAKRKGYTKKWNGLSYIPIGWLWWKNIKATNRW